MPLSYRENYLRNASFQYPEFIPMHIGISNASWDQWRSEMEDVVVRHPSIWPGFEKGKRDWDHFDFGPAYTKGVPFRDAWGCVWETDINGIEGVVKESPLSDWANWDNWRAPNPLETADRGPVDWGQRRRDIEAAKQRGDLTSGGLPHGFFFMRLTYLRGFENMMVDMATEHPMLWKLIDVLYEHNRIIVDQFLEMGVDMMSIGEDLGAQNSSIISPAMFRKYCRPTYEKLLQPCRERGIHVMLHSDGYIMDLVDDLLMSGVTILNPQDLCNGIENIRRELKGRVCIRLDVDRQKIVPYGTRQEIRELIEEEVRVLGSPQGGLEFICGIYPPTPPENVDAVACAFEEFRTYWWDGRGGA
ncbi:MAG TPA: uroporphyrinogen decarboxylase family protein [Candidatus Hydrogenedentes bacterium]|nr:uroporphyrinogen decarboxylase family protein [Candidatus Hydrogenedentota bacterium]HOL77620.1 uroporphyrinogen decarboxylase family protein [Candidatus Hydrogenedentota bacterium]HPO86745.1 uroporphyrinogen decarboxylase family protein [Candidatus Hydrogenedentota bacterium]